MPSAKTQRRKHTHKAGESDHPTPDAMKSPLQPPDRSNDRRAPDPPAGFQSRSNNNSSNNTNSATSPCSSPPTSHYAYIPNLNNRGVGLGSSNNKAGVVGSKILQKKLAHRREAYQGPVDVDEVSMNSFSDSSVSATISMPSVLAIDSENAKQILDGELQEQQPRQPQNHQQTAVFEVANKRTRPRTQSGHEAQKKEHHRQQKGARTNQKLGGNGSVMGDWSVISGGAPDDSSASESCYLPGDNSEVKSLDPIENTEYISPQPEYTGLPEHKTPMHTPARTPTRTPTTGDARKPSKPTTTPPSLPTLNRTVSPLGGRKGRRRGGETEESKDEIQSIENSIGLKTPPSNNGRVYSFDNLNQVITHNKNNRGAMAFYESNKKLQEDASLVVWAVLEKTEKGTGIMGKAQPQSHFSYVDNITSKDCYKAIIKFAKLKLDLSKLIKDYEAAQVNSCALNDEWALLYQQFQDVILRHAAPNDNINNYDSPDEDQEKQSNDVFEKNYSSIMKQMKRVQKALRTRSDQIPMLQKKLQQPTVSSENNDDNSFQDHSNMDKNLDQINNEVHSLNNEIAYLKNQLAVAHTSITQLKEQNKHTTVSHDKSKDDENENNERIQSLLNKLQEITAENEKLSEKKEKSEEMMISTKATLYETNLLLEASKEELQKLRAEKHEASNRLEQTEMALETLKSQHMKEQQMQVQESTAASLPPEHDDQKNKVDDSDDSSVFLPDPAESNNKATLELIDRLKEQLLESQQKEKEALEAVEKLNNQLNETKLKINEMEQHHNKNEVEKEMVNNDAMKQELLLVSLQEDLHKSQEECKFQKDVNQKVQEKLVQVTYELETLKEVQNKQQAQLEQQKSDHDKKEIIRLLEERVKVFEEKEQQMANQITKLQAQLKENEKESIESSKQNNEQHSVTVRTAISSTPVASQESSSEETSEEMDELRRKFKRSEINLHRRQKEYDILNSEVIELRSQLTDTQQTIEDLEQERLFGRAKVAELSELLESRGKTDIEQQLIAKASKCAELSAEIEFMKSKLAEKAAKVDKLEAKHEANTSLVKELTTLLAAQGGDALGAYTISTMAQSKSMDDNNGNKIDARTATEPAMAEQSSALLSNMLVASQERADRLQQERDISTEKAAKLSIELAESRSAVDELTEMIKEQEQIINRSQSDHGGGLGSLSGSYQHQLSMQGGGSPQDNLQQQPSKLLSFMSRSKVQQQSGAAGRFVNRSFATISQSLQTQLSNSQRSAEQNQGQQSPHPPTQRHMAGLGGQQYTRRAIVTSNMNFNADADSAAGGKPPTMPPQFQITDDLDKVSKSTRSQKLMDTMSNDADDSPEAQLATIDQLMQRIQRLEDENEEF